MILNYIKEVYNASQRITPLCPWQLKHKNSLRSYRPNPLSQQCICNAYKLLIKIANIVYSNLKLSWIAIERRKKKVYDALEKVIRKLLFVHTVTTCHLHIASANTHSICVRYTHKIAILRLIKDRFTFYYYRKNVITFASKNHKLLHPTNLHVYPFNCFDYTFGYIRQNILIIKLQAFGRNNINKGCVCRIP